MSSTSEITFDKSLKQHFENSDITWNSLSSVLHYLAGSVFLAETKRVKVVNEPGQKQYLNIEWRDGSITHMRF